MVGAQSVAMCPMAKAGFGESSLGFEVTYFAKATLGIE